MDEQEWLSTESFYEMVEYLRLTTNLNRTKAGRRKFRLVSCACARRVWHLMNEPCRNLVVAVEQLVDDLITQDRFAFLHQIVTTTYRDDVGRRVPQQTETGMALVPAILNRGYAVVWSLVVPNYPAQMTMGAASGAAGELAYILRSEQGEDAMLRFMREEPRRQTDLLREIFGNPFRPLPKRKFPAEVRGLAQSAYEDASHYPVLADALADLGEDEAAEHCRQPGHVKGCHVVDWVLGRA